MGWKQARLESPWPRAFAWVESHLGGTIVGYGRRAWWRPAWFLEAVLGRVNLGRLPDVG